MTKNSEDKFDLLKDCLKALTIRINKDEESYFVTCKQKIWSPEIEKLLSPENIIRYKQHYWAAGSVDHEDVLYFAHQLLLRFPVLRRVLSSRFPYLFIDEFQDTIPVQAEIVSWLANEGTVVGVIGDPAQAIYGFVDATPSHFHEFDLDGHHTYSIQGNRRSSKAIVSLLNRIRTDGLGQKPLREYLGTHPVFYSGDLLKALGHAKQNSSHANNMLVLARSHKGVLQAKRVESNFVDDPWNHIAKTDVNRFRFLQHLITSVDLANRGFYELAMQRLVRGISTRNKFREPFKFSGEITTIQRKSIALSLLELMTSRKTELTTLTVLESYQLIQEHVGLELEGLSLPKAMRGKFFEAASKCNYLDLLSSIRTPEETRLIRTIHQAKGSEADAVFVILENDAANHILSPVADNEEHQITYVALSRARNELFIYCPDNDIWTSPKMSKFTTSSIRHMNPETV